jgi:hypothetical protein
MVERQRCERHRHVLGEQLHPAAVAVGVVAVDRLFGLVGLIVSVPILVTVKVLLEELWIKPLEESRTRAATTPSNGSGDVVSVATGAVRRQVGRIGLPRRG